MADSQPVQIGVDPNFYHVNLANINFDEESFMVLFVSGNQGRQFHLTPKHAKRLFLLLEKQISEYESKFGELKTELPKANEGTGKEPVGFTVQDKKQA